jgi:hypothetical protein
MIVQQMLLQALMDAAQCSAPASMISATEYINRMLYEVLYTCLRFTSTVCLKLLISALCASYADALQLVLVYVVLGCTSIDKVEVAKLALSKIRAVPFTPHRAGCSVSTAKHAFK